MTYDFNSIEARWQAFWAERKTFRTPNPGDPGFDPAKPKFYVLDMFPYPSGVGLHVGHPLGYIATDIVARYKRMQGFNVLHTMGYDAFGLPAEQFAVERGVHPRITTAQNIANMTRQLKLLGLSYDWDRELSTTDPDYFRWTQWIFLQLYNAWYDSARRKARPIAELLAALEGEDYYINVAGELVTSGDSENLESLMGAPIGVRKWHELSNEERTRVLDDQRLAYLAEVPVNWCPALGTVLANEEVTNEGRSERGNHPVFKRPLRQWMLRITAYAERLGDDLELVDWPDAIKLMQRNWIGKSEGALVDFTVAGPDGKASDETITVFTTRPDTLFGATYMVLAPEHPLVSDITTAAQRDAVAAYQTQASRKTDVDRQTEAASGAKTGVFTGAYAINPVNGDLIPIWTADYVMMGYGTGAIMAVPAHDQRDHDFARRFNLPIKQVIAGPAETDVQKKSWEGDGAAVNSANSEVSLNGLNTADAKKRITQWLASKNLGRPQVQYKLRDWLFSRQRYWGEPFPILHGPDGEIVALDASDLPVELPEMSDFSPAASDDPNAPPQPPLSRAPESWKFVTRHGRRYSRELNTMPQWAGSCWYYLRFIDPKNTDRFVGREAEAYWMGGGQGARGQGARGPKAAPSLDPSTPGPLGPSPQGIDLYVGGAEHAVLHLLYARFWHKVLFDLGHISTPEPFGRLFNQGYIQAHAYTDSRGIYVPAEEVEEKDGKFLHQGVPVNREFGKMGKSLKNAVAPDDIAREYGCDTLRLYEMYLGPLDQSKVWNTRDIVGAHRFLQRLWRNFVNPETGAWLVADTQADADLRRAMHKTIKRVTDAMNSMSFNVAIASLIELNNELVRRFASDNPGGGAAKTASLPREVAQTLVLLLAPLAPHIAEELWHRLGHPASLSEHPWPIHDPALLVEDSVEYPVQVNGKLRGRVTVPAAADQSAIEAAALADEKVQAALGGKPPRKVIVIKGKMVNIVV